MKNTIVIFSGMLLLLVAGCSTPNAARPRLIDPRYTQYQRNLDDLEREYLHKKITYAEYRERKQQLDEEYSRTGHDATSF